MCLPANHVCKMAPIDSFLRRIFINLESFLQKVAEVDVFEVLVFNYKIKSGLADPKSVSVLSVVRELTRELEVLSREYGETRDFLEGIPLSVTQDGNLSSSLSFTKTEESCQEIPLVLSFCNDECSDKPVELEPCITSDEVKFGSETAWSAVKTDMNTHTTSVGEQKLDLKEKNSKIEKQENTSQKEGAVTEKAKSDLLVSKCNKCEHCNRKFPSATKLLAHSSKCPKAANKNDSEAHHCSYCDLVFMTQALLTSHINRIHQVPSVSPAGIVNQNSCLLPEDSSQFGVVEIQTLPDDLPFFCCKTCYSVYKTTVDFESHPCKENVNNSVEETKMGDYFHLTGKYLITNPERLKLLRKFRCGTCKEEYRSLERILYHIPRCTQGPYRCELCSVEYTTKKDLNLHKKKAHKDANSFFCDECGLAFKLRTSLQKHKVNRHEQEQGSFNCDQCQKSFTKRVQLTNHKIQCHRLERKFLCQVCGNKFSTHGSLMAHLDTHTELRKFACVYCNKKFRQKEKLKFHTRIHTGERPHLCQTCGKGFIRKSKLDEHMRRHRGEKHYQCQQCNKSYANNWDLKMHIRKQHPTTKLEVEMPSQAVPSVPTGSRENEGEESTHTPVASTSEDNLLVLPESTSVEVSEITDPGVSQLDVPQLVQQNNSDLVVHNGTNGSNSSILLQLNAVPPSSNQTVAAEEVTSPDDSTSRILQLEPTQIQNQLLTSENGNSRILVHLGGDGSRIVVHLDPAQNQTAAQTLLPGQALPANTLVAVADAIHLTPMVDEVSNISLGGVATQYIHLAAAPPQPAATSTSNVSGTGGSLPVHIQLPVSAVPVSAISQQGSGSTAYGLQPVPVQGHTGLVFTPAGFDVNGMTY